MNFTLDTVQLLMAERRREADRSRLAELARRVAACCAPATLRSRITRALRPMFGS